MYKVRIGVGDMIDLEQIKLRLESLNKRRPGHLTPDECSRLLPIFSDLIEEAERLQEEDKAGDKIIEDLGNDIERFKMGLDTLARENSDLERQLNCSKGIQ